jgi:2-oxoacid:acceptor oxidoreductase delta subunit (pyruvate/2-ketoisovalerate family)
MPAHQWKVEAAEAEGVVIHPEHAIRAILRQGEQLLGVECKDVSFMEFSQNGCLTLETRTGSDHTIPCETVIFAIGQVPDASFLAVSGEMTLTARGLISVDSVTLASGRPGVFAGGDAVPGCRTAAEALRFGKRAALSIDVYLSGESATTPEEQQPVAYQELNVSYFGPSERMELPHLSATERKRVFREVSYSGYDEPAARSEASRCFSCGECFRCDNCWIFCPDMAVIRHQGNQGYRFEYSYCKGCGICVRECPSSSIEMTPDEVKG